MHSYSLPRFFLLPDLPLYPWPWRFTTPTLSLFTQLLPFSSFSSSYSNYFKNGVPTTHPPIYLQDLGHYLS